MVRDPEVPASDATEGQAVPARSVIANAPGAQLTLQPHPGIAVLMAGITQRRIDSLASGADGVRHAMLMLRSGRPATSLDLKFRKLNDLPVRPAEGVASAHGAPHTVSALDGEVCVRRGSNAPVKIVGRTPADLASFLTCDVNTISFGAAVASNAPGWPAAPVAEVTAGLSTQALVEASGDATGLAATLADSIVATAVSSGNEAIADEVLRSVAVAEVKSRPDTDLVVLANELSSQAGAVGGNPRIDHEALASGVSNALRDQPGAGAITPAWALTGLIEVGGLDE